MCTFEIFSSLPLIEFSYNEVMLLTHVFNTQPQYGRYNGIPAACRLISNNRILVGYFVGKSNGYTDTRKIQLILYDDLKLSTNAETYVSCKYIQFNEKMTNIIYHRMRKFYYEYLPAIESEILDFKLNNYLPDMTSNLTDTNDNIFKYRINVINNDIKIRFLYS